MHNLKWIVWVGLVLVGALAVACSQPPVYTQTPTATPEAAPTNYVPSTRAVPTQINTPTPTPTGQPDLVPVRLEVLDGSEARYLVKEQFARRNAPNDAVGKTNNVTGAILFDPAGEVVTVESKLVVDLQTLRSDDDDRDDYLRGESLESDRYPLAEFVVQEAPGLPWPLPMEGEASFQLVGDMTIHDNTSPLSWEVTAIFSEGQITGTAKTNFTFGAFHLVRPSRFFLLSVEDDIRLEIDFVVSVQEDGE